MTNGKFGRFIRIEDTTWPNPDYVDEMDHRLRYGLPLEREDLLFVAEALRAYCFLANGKGKYGRESLARLWRGVRLGQVVKDRSGSPPCCAPVAGNSDSEAAYYQLDCVLPSGHKGEHHVHLWDNAPCVCGAVQPDVNEATVEVTAMCTFYREEPGHDE